MAKSNAHKQLMEFSEWEARQPGSYDIIVDGKIYNVTDIYEPVLPPNPDKLSLTEKQKREVEELAEDIKGLWFMHLRHTAVTRLAEASVPKRA